MNNTTKLTKINPKVAFKPWFYSLKQTLIETITTINRIRSNHTLSPTYKFKMKLIDSPFSDGGCLDDLNHIFFGCPIYKAEIDQLIFNVNQLKHQPPFSIYFLLDVTPLNTAGILIK